MTVHGAHLKVCKVKVGTALRIRVRVDNRLGAHRHAGLFANSRTGRTLRFNVASGRISPVKTLRARSGDDFAGGLRESGTPEVGLGYRLSDIRRC